MAAAPSDGYVPGPTRAYACSVPGLAGAEFNTWKRGILSAESRNDAAKMIWRSEPVRARRTTRLVSAIGRVVAYDHDLLYGGRMSTLTYHLAAAAFGGDDAGE